MAQRVQSKPKSSVCPSLYRPEATSTQSLQQRIVSGCQAQQGWLFQTGSGWRWHCQQQAHPARVSPIGSRPAASSPASPATSFPSGSTQPLQPACTPFRTPKSRPRAEPSSTLPARTSQSPVKTNINPSSTWTPATAARCQIMTLPTTGPGGTHGLVVVAGAKAQCHKAHPRPR